MASSAMPNAVQIRDLNKRFVTNHGEFVALESVDLTVTQGEFLVIVGPSGCGKTTLLRIIQNLETATSGILEVGRPDGYHGRARLGYVFQRAALLPWRTVRENVKFGLGLKTGRDVFGDRKAESEQIADLLAITGLTEFGNYFPAQLSGGMQQRVNLARALAIKPHLLLMDEPFSALDALTKERLERELAEIVRKVGTTVIFVTHDIRQAVFLGDRVVVMGAKPGRITHEVAIDEPRPRLVEFQQSVDLTLKAKEIWGLMASDAEPPSQLVER